MTVRMNWREDAACGDADPDLFFPIGTTGNALRQIDEAKRICRFCPVQIQCLAWALETGVTDGVWGGVTEDERRAIRSLSRRSTSKEDNDGETYRPAGQQFADLAKATRLARTFAFLERVLYADFSTCGDLYTHRETIAALLAPWFSRRTVADLAAAFAGTSVPWARLHNLTGRQPPSR
jgi:WhiB family redox-sensing transcriptional regulator